MKCLQWKRFCETETLYGWQWKSDEIMDSTQHIHTHTHLTALSPGPSRWAGTRKAKPIRILLEQETVSGIGVSWAICKSASRSMQITMPASPALKCFTGHVITSCLLGTQQQTSTSEVTNLWHYRNLIIIIINLLHAATAVDGRDRETDTVLLHRSCSQYYVGSANKHTNNS